MEIRRASLTVGITFNTFLSPSAHQNLYILITSQTKKIPSEMKHFRDSMELCGSFVREGDSKNDKVTHTH